MKRVPEPELMQNLHQVMAYSECDFSSSDDALLHRLEEYLIQKGLNPDEKTVFIDLGCGPGNIAQRIASRWPASKVIGVDGSRSMLAVARKRKELAADQQKLNRLSYVCLDISKCINGIQPFEGDFSGDIVVSNSLLHHFYSPNDFWRALPFFSAVGALHLHRDLRRPSTISEAKSLQEKHLPNSPEVLSNDFLASLKAAFTILEIKDQLTKEGFLNFNVSELDDRYLEVDGIYKVFTDNSASTY